MLFIIFSLRVLAQQYVFAAQPKLPVGSDVEGMRPKVFAKKWPKAGKYLHYHKVTAWNTSQYWYPKSYSTTYIRKGSVR